MKNKKFLLLLLVGVFSCSSNHEPQNICNFKTIISKKQYTNLKSDSFKINSLSINDNCLTINFTSSGCSGDSWGVSLIDSEAILESNPAQRNLKLILKNNEACLAIVTKELTFDISNLQTKSNNVILNISNYNQSILYKY